MRDEAENLRRAFGWDCPVLAREWVDLREVGSSVYGPVPFEIRVWVVDGLPIAWSFHYLNVVSKPEGFPPGPEDLRTLSKIAASVAPAFRSRFIVVDVAKRKKGGWVMIEAGPGSCAGTGHEGVFRHVCSRLRGEKGGFSGDDVGGPLT
ncbi:MAG: ATP-grasp domain-containing protein [Planctomycetota bacterium]